MTWALTMGLFIIVGGVLSMPYVLRTNYDIVSSENINVEATSAPIQEVVAHVSTPEKVKAIYMTACVAGTPSWRKSLKELIETTELNSVVIDIKDYTGDVSFKQGAKCFVRDLKEFIAELHESDIYVIGRISVFQDPAYTKLHPELAVKSKNTGGVWKDRKGLSFVDVSSKPYWEHIVALSNESYELGFDELNFDYIRYPSDGDMKDAEYANLNASTTKAMMLESFFSYLKNELDGTGVVTSADLFGLTTVAYDDLGIGQELKRALPYFDYVAPMVYPSHFAKGTNGLTNPAANPYEIIKYSMSGGREKEILLYGTSTPSKLRPWIQDFDLGATYGVAEVKAQIRASDELGLPGWMIWDPANRYTTAAFDKAPLAAE